MRSQYTFSYLAARWTSEIECLAFFCWCWLIVDVHSWRIWHEMMVKKNMIRTMFVDQPTFGDIASCELRRLLSIYSGKWTIKNVINYKICNIGTHWHGLIRTRLRTKTCAWETKRYSFRTWRCCCVGLAILYCNFCCFCKYILLNYIDLYGTFILYFYYFYLPLTSW